MILRKYNKVECPAAPGPWPQNSGQACEETAAELQVPGYLSLMSTEHKVCRIHACPVWWLEPIFLRLLTRLKKVEHMAPPQNSL